jgi:hypothetical protein
LPIQHGKGDAVEEMQGDGEVQQQQQQKLPISYGCVMSGTGAAAEVEAELMKAMTLSQGEN